MTVSVSDLQAALKTATEDIPTAAESDDRPSPACVFTPVSHLKALRPQTLLVSGARGAGKTFWTLALHQKSIREMLQQDVPELANVRVRIGYTSRANPEAYPSSQQCSLFLQTFDAYDVWRTVWVRALADQPEVKPLSPCPGRSWSEDVRIVAQKTEEVDRFFFEANRILAENDVKVLVLFDALDRVAESWQDIDCLTMALMKMTLELSTFSNIKGKIFLREDHCNRLSFNFRDASKLLATKVDLSWKRAELYALLWKRFCNSDGMSGELLRLVFEEICPQGLQERDGIWNFERTIELSDDNFRKLFHRLAGPYMGKNQRRGVPYVWTVGHLADSRQQASPRSFLAAVCYACDDSRQNHRNAPYAIHYDSIKLGVRAASEIRVNEMKEDNPWVGGLLESLRGVTVPCSFREVQDIWEARYPRGPVELVEQHPRHAPPEFASQQWPEVKNLLERLGFCTTMTDGRFNMPDLYRIGFGLGRKGGVKPLK